LETTGEGAQFRGAGLDACPEPGGVHHVEVLLPKLADEHRPPDGVIDTGADPFPQPGIRGDALQGLPIRRELEVDADEAEANQVDRPEVAQRELDGFDVRVKGLELVLVIHHGPRAAKDDLVAPAQLVDQPEHVLVGREPVVVELLH
jgi:hypothetical protein